MAITNPQTDAQWAAYAMQLAADGQLSMQESQELADLIQSRPDLMGRLEQFRAQYPEQYQYLIDYAPTIIGQYPTLQPLWNVLPGYIPPIDPGSTPAPTVPALDPNEGARAALMRTLSDFGLDSLGDWVWEQFLDGVPIQQIFLDMRERDEYKARFPAIRALAEQGRAIDEATYIGLERSYVEVMVRGGVPGGFYDNPEDFAAWIEGNVSPAELSDRVLDKWARVAQTSPEVRDYFQQEFGVSGDNALLMVYLDPEKALPELEKMTTIAEFGGIGSQFGFQVAGQTAARAQEVGVDAGQARQGFSALAQLPGLFRETISEGTDLRAEVEGTQAMFDLTPLARRQLERRRESREAAFSGSSSAGGIDAGAGLGSAEPKRRR